jgi:hypothetical protein
MDAQSSGTADLCSADDTLLAALVSTAETSAPDIPLTLLIGGTFVSSKLVESHIYLDGIAETSRSFGKVWDSAIQSVRNEYGLDSDSSALDAAVSMPSFVHLRDVRFSPASPQASAAWWRGRSSAIDGWFIGLIG